MYETEGIQASDVSSCYIGPFGRILPILKDVPKLSNCPRGESPDPAVKVSSYQHSLMREPISLEFGTDTSLKPSVETPRCEAMLSPDPPSPTKQDEPCDLELLPSERQLLTPSSPSSLPNSPPASRPRLNFSASPSITSAQLFSPVDGTLSNTPALPLHSHDSSEDMDMTAGTSVNPTLASDPINSLYEQCFPQVAGYAPTLCLNTQASLPQGARPFTPPEMDYQIPRYHQGQLPYHPNLPTIETPPSSDPINADSDGLPQPLHPLLPHVIDEQIVDGEGVCYIYSDGSYCPKTIDGEPVNANWGVTKAGKPRKRLAQACMTCREKKIKCHPNLPKCDQCQKSGRSCRYASASRGNQSSKKPQPPRKARGSKEGLVANSPNLRYPGKTTKTTTFDASQSYSCAISFSRSPKALSPSSDCSLSLFPGSAAEGLPQPNNIPELGRPAKRRK